MRKYELMYILRADLDEAARETTKQELADLLVANGATVEKTDESMGLRELAYPIKDETKGYYVVLKVSMDNTAIYEFNRKTRHNPNVLRHLIIAEDK